MWFMWYPSHRRASTRWKKANRSPLCFRRPRSTVPGSLAAHHCPHKQHITPWRESDYGMITPVFLWLVFQKPCFVATRNTFWVYVKLEYFRSIGCFRFAWGQEQRSCKCLFSFVVSTGVQLIRWSVVLETRTLSFCQVPLKGFGGITEKHETKRCLPLFHSGRKDPEWFVRFEFSRFFAFSERWALLTKRPCIPALVEIVVGLAKVVGTKERKNNAKTRLIFTSFSSFWIIVQSKLPAGCFDVASCAASQSS